MDNEYEVIIIGGGPNGLTAGAYLAKSDIKVLVLDSELEVGGGLATEEVTIPPFMHNTHSIWHMMVDQSPIYQDLELEARYQVRYVWPELQFAMPLKDGRCLCLHQDVDKTCKSIAQFSQEDAESYRQLHGKMRQYFDEFLGPATYVLPVPALEQLVKLQSSAICEEFSDYSEMTPLEIIEKHFKDDHVKTLMLYVACHWGLQYDVNGLGYLAVLNLERATNYRLAIGGSHTVASGIIRFMIEHGGLTLGNKHVTKILMEDGVAKGVKLRDGSEIRATKGILSTLDPETTFLKLVGEENMEGQLVAKTKMWQWEKWSLLQIHLAMEEPPQFTAAASDLDINKACVYLVGYESTAELIDHWEAIKRGEISDKAGFLCCFPSVHDPLQAPDGRCTGLISQMNPYRVGGTPDPWLRYKFKEALAEKRIAKLQEYAPNVNEDTVLWHYACTPGDIPNKFANMVEGSYKEGAYLPLQMGYNRPNDLCSHYRTPVKGLYLGGSCTHPGGMVTFGPGYNAAGVMVEDLGANKWWSDSESVAKAKAKGLL